ncbi:MAG: hypothetical protein J0L70_07625 [Leptolyngbya sp. UWPOB_LEPTO1]|uniref:hypothetical protein n=1 Tax=Leptolyngbya sp. UWPOB_LEPTO1 TaxID=2815653 RepID=UPI001AD0A224|nr:hypothetical protein [Leptolyngbya sp. UWPOB_LEPTO1]MBN8560373.1 hypothetical protein [Leptolyngbya sp. UWPOB_LEPTO1]
MMIAADTTAYTSSIATQDAFTFGLASSLGALELDDRKIRRIQALLPAMPKGLGPDCSQRERWNIPSVRSLAVRSRLRANQLLAQPFPAWSNRAYLRFSRDGNRAEGEQMLFNRQNRLSILVIAECVQGQGRYIPEIEKTLRELIAQPTWILPAHDPKLGSLNGQYLVDLNSASIAHEIAHSLYLLKSSLSPDLYQQVVDALRQRVFDPVKQSLQTGKGNDWLKEGSNWNAVCLAGVVGAALAVLPDLNERSLIAAAGEHYIRNYLASFPENGYSSEGPLYWNYGFSYYVLLRELLRANTNGEVDLFAPDGRDTSTAELLKQRNIALYAARIQMFPNNVAAFGDASPRTSLGADPGTLAMFDYLSKVWDLNQPSRLGNTYASWSVVRQSLILFAQPIPIRLTAKAGLPAYDRTTEQLGYYFAHQGIMLSRGGDLAITIKGGGRQGRDGGLGANTSHSHNDIGSYTIAIGNEQPAGDVGAPIYSARTFNQNRYNIRAINSYGHPVPIVAGQLQVRADQLPYVPILNARQSPEQDSILINMRPAYQVDGLQRLTRGMVYYRKAANQATQITIEDRFAFDRPQNFETALTTLGSWKRKGRDTLILTDRTKSVQVKIQSSSALILKPEKINEEGLTFTRLGLAFQSPRDRGYIRMIFTQTGQRSF